MEALRAWNVGRKRDTKEIEGADFARQSAASVGSLGGMMLKS